MEGHELFMQDMKSHVPHNESENILDGIMGCSPFLT
jgi:hypothetical protein